MRFIRDLNRLIYTFDILLERLVNDTTHCMFSDCATHRLIERYITPRLRLLPPRLRLHQPRLSGSRRCLSAKLQVHSFTSIVLSLSSDPGLLGLAFAGGCMNNYNSLKNTHEIGHKSFEAFICMHTFSKTSSFTTYSQGIIVVFVL